MMNDERDDDDEEEDDICVSEEDFIAQYAVDSCLALINCSKSVEIPDSKVTTKIMLALDILYMQTKFEKGVSALLCLSLLELVEQILVLNESKLPPDHLILPGILRIYTQVILKSPNKGLDRTTMKKVMKLIFLERICTVLACGDEDATATAIGILCLRH